jgi:CubicO group peptidase (beta-lactamase class C family)
MSKKLLVITLIVLCGGLFSISALSKNPFPENYQQNLDALLEQVIKHNEPGALVMVMDRGNIKYVTSRGVTSLDTMQLVTSETQFRLASLSKPFTAYGIYLLEQQGRLDTTFPISTYIDNTPDSWRHLTVKDLLHNQSGINDIFSLLSIKYNGYERASESLEEVIEIIKAQEKLNTIGKSKPMLYSNSNYVLLAHIIEQVTQQSFANWMLDNVFKPLKMKNTYVFENDSSTTQDIAKGYWKENGKFEATEHAYELHGATGVISTAEDLSRWFAFLHQESSVAMKLFEAPKSHNFVGGMFAYFGGEKAPLTLYLNAKVAGYTSSFYLNRDSNLATMVFSLNEDVQSIDLITRVDDAIWYGKLPQPQRQTSVSPLSDDELALYEGAYLGSVSSETDLDTNYFVQIASIGGKLYEKADKDKYLLNPVGYFQFRFAHSPNMQVSFFNEAPGEVMAAFKVFENTYNRVEVAPPKSLLNSIEGTYYNSALNTQLKVTVSAAGKTTMHHQTADQAFELFTIDQDEIYSHMLGGSNITPIWHADEIKALSLADARAANVEFARVD